MKDTVNQCWLCQVGAQQSERHSSSMLAVSSLVHSSQKDTVHQCWLCQVWCTAVRKTQFINAGCVKLVHSNQKDTVHQCWLCQVGAQQSERHSSSMLAVSSWCTAVRKTQFINAGCVKLVHSSQKDTVHQCWLCQVGAQQSERHSSSMQAVSSLVHSSQKDTVHQCWLCQVWCTAVRKTQFINAGCVKFGAQQSERHSSSMQAVSSLVHSSQKDTVHQCRLCQVWCTAVRKTQFINAGCVKFGAQQSESFTTPMAWLT